MQLSITPDRAFEVLYIPQLWNIPDVRYHCLTHDSSYQIYLGKDYVVNSLAFEEQPHYLKYAVLGSSNAKDTIYGVRANFEFNNAWLSPCYFLVGSNEPGFEEQPKISELTIFPNPAFNAIAIKLPVNKGMVFLSKITGKVIRKMWVHSVSNVFNMKLEDIPIGFYVLSFVEENGKVWTQKLIVQR